MRHCAIQTALMDVVHGAMCTSMLTTTPTFTQDQMHNQPGVTKFSSALPASPGWLHDVHQQPVCRPTNPPNGASTTTRLSWRCKSLLKVSKRRYLLLPVWGLKVTTSPAPAPRSGPGSPPAAPGFNSDPIAPLARRVASRTHNLAPPAPRPVGDSFSRAQSGLT